MKRHYRSPEDYWLIRAQSKRHQVHIVFWTWKKHRIVRTKVEGLRLIRLWKDWHRRCGWQVKGNVAIPPDKIKELRAIGLRTIPVDDIKKIKLPET